MCPNCGKKLEVVRIDFENHTVTLVCKHCGWESEKEKIEKVINGASQAVARLVKRYDD